MTAVRFDSVAFKAEQRDTWNAVSAGWDFWQDRYERAAAPVTEWLLRAAALRPGHRVLDVGCGTGEPSVSAGRLVAPTGRVLGIDLAPEMVDRARRCAAGLGHPIEFAESDVEALDLPARSFDAVLSRWGLMFAVDRRRTLASLHRLLAPGGVLAAAVWGPPEANPMTSLGFRTLAAGLPGPPPDRPGPFSMADAARTRADLLAAGFTDVDVEPVGIAIRFSCVDEYLAYTRDVTPPGVLAAVRHQLGADAERASWERLTEAAAVFADEHGVVTLPGSALCLRARRAPAPETAAADTTATAADTTATAADTTALDTAALAADTTAPDTVGLAPDTVGLATAGPATGVGPAARRSATAGSGSPPTAAPGRAG
ncbi:Ubiquinone/menaquinone biosynthesis C-methylase UbiE [Micromonospora citrea]|uniref:Ubiquinone/menaquinone biosynthesis C-methylase UbiE n=1 Tax=Micromonospora citrea TaxID=47855 RepID=A0A1C6VZA8_9ACTN|nr:Ubiquinone/menaquinone biosynthesis C-methylase UbiE [Micromonospora citrea]